MTINFNNSITPGEITADEHLLNFISILAMEAADKFERDRKAQLGEIKHFTSN